MEKMMYLMMIAKSKTYRKMTKQAVTEHVANIRKLDDEGKLEICGVFHGYPGMAGMYILKTDSREEAEEICNLSISWPADCKPGKQLPAVKFLPGRQNTPSHSNS